MDFTMIITGTANLCMAGFMLRVPGRRKL